MDRRHFLALSVATVGTLAGCPARSREAGSGTTPGDTPDGTPTDTATATETATPARDPLDGSWASYQNDAANTGATADSGPAEDPTEQWRHATTTGQPATAPVAVDGVFVVVSEAGVPYAREVADGSVRWVGSRSVETRVEPVASERTVVAVDGTTLVGLAADTGDQRWAATLDASIVGLGTVDGRIVVATEGGVTAFAPADGTRQWRYSVDGEVVTSPGVGSETVALGLSGGSVRALDASDGSEQWRVSVGTDPAFAPAVGSEHVYVTTDSRLRALDAESGNKQWDYRTNDPVAAVPVATADAVYVVTLDDDAEGRVQTTDPDEGTPTPTPTDVRWFEGTVLALSPGDGEAVWRVTRTERYNFTSGPPEELHLRLAGDLVLAGLGGTLVAYDAAGEEMWSANATAVTPAVTDGVVSTGSVGYSLATGDERWRFRTGRSVTVPPAVVGNTVYAGSDDNYLYALAAHTGDIRWTARTDDMIRGAPAVGDDAVYVGTISGTLYAFDRNDGTELWSVSVGSQPRAPVVRDGTVYLGNFSSTVRAIDAADGTERWRTEVDSKRFVALEVAVADGAVYAGANGDLRAFETSDGTERWRFRVGEKARVQSPPAVSGGRVFLNLGDALRAIDTTDGSEVWSTPHDSNANEPPVVRDGVVYTSADGTVYAVDAADGTELWTRSAPGSTMALAAGADVIYGRGHDTPLVALEADDGSVRWRDRSVDPSSPPAIADGHLFVGDRSGAILSLGSRE